MLKDWKEKRDADELEELDQKRSFLEHRLHRSQTLHHLHLQRVSSEAKIKNSQIISRLESIKQRKHQEELNTIKRFEDHEKEVLKKLKNNYEDFLFQYEQMKEEKR
jgi:hypothetical protein